MVLSPRFWSTACLLLGSLHARIVDAIQTVSAVGSKFFYEDGTQYFLKGVAYQLVPEDPLVDTAQCQHDIERMAELGTNAIRVYHVDPDANHDGCMNALADAGIYLFVDLDTFDTSIQPDDPQWTESQFDRYKAVLDEFQRYSNTAGVFVGNEVLTTSENSAAASYVLAAARDIKSYRSKKGYRQIPVGYSAADVAELQPMLQNYLACRPDPEERLDFFALNAYEWCGPSSYEESGYKHLQNQAHNYPIPIFFSETGCNVARPRTFEDQAAIFGDDMSETWSGSIVYEWIEETNDYGLISYGATVSHDAVHAAKPMVQDGFTRQGVPTPISPDFDNLKSQWASLTPTGIALSDYIKSISTISPPKCPSSTPGGWSVDPSAPLPTLQQSYQQALPTSTTGHRSGDAGSEPAAKSGSVTASSRLGSPSASASATYFNYTLSNAGNPVSVPRLNGFDRLADGILMFSAFAVLAVCL
ncbi:hypothetical protein EYZ11_000264 [Aspergillus tanneri]|uniref:1,3-beta-glucanosyltransferase n=1 Tax=Aspergillus tanneri TaxID=1220188 RepID=A0A4S3JXW4_9EURO|nr:hypothetical protein EYZ11_000264 [Aspergillus tanneri]